MIFAYNTISINTDDICLQYNLYKYRLYFPTIQTLEIQMIFASNTNSINTDDICLQYKLYKYR